jgi:hypothetical protein
MSFFDKMKEKGSQAAAQMQNLWYLCKRQTVGWCLRETEIANELSLIERIDTHIQELQDEISDLQHEFKNTESNVVDATEVKEKDTDE